MNSATDPRRRFGNRGEDLAAAFFELRGFTIVARNWSCRMGEIDVIVEKDSVTHFVEVKTRRTLTYGRPEEAITPSKLAHFRRAIEAYLRECVSPPIEYQADALAITCLDGQAPEYYFIEHVL